MRTYAVISISNEAGPCGPEISDMHLTGRKVELPDNPSLHDMMEALKDEGLMYATVGDWQVYVDEWEAGADSRDFTLRGRAKGEWLWRLTPAT